MLFRFAKVKRKKFGLFFGSAFQILSLPVEAGCKGTESFSGNKKNFLFFSALLGFQAAFVSLVRSIWECKNRADFREYKE